MIITNSSSINKVEKLLMKLQDRNKKMQQQINSIDKKVNDPLHKSEHAKQMPVFEYANIEKIPHKNKAINPSSEITNNTSNQEAFLREKETDETMPKWSEANHITRSEKLLVPNPSHNYMIATESKQLI